MKLRRRGSRAVQESIATPDPVAATVWEEGHLTGSANVAPIIHAPRAGDVVPQ